MYNTFLDVGSGPGFISSPRTSSLSIRPAYFQFGPLLNWMDNLTLEDERDQRGQEVESVAVGACREDGLLVLLFNLRECSIGPDELFRFGLSVVLGVVKLSVFLYNIHVHTA